ncbi:MAG: class I SAM-dependent methyltransferase [Firmicutes bacterium]|nr:class I SAM-dependent methyltransferase [Bacillota bacterium]
MKNKNDKEHGLTLSDNSEVYYDKNDLYVSFAEAEDSLGLVEKALRPEIKGKVVIDIGCGTGKYVRLFKPYTQFITGIDLSPQQVLIAGEGSDAKFIVAGADKIPYPDNFFDVAYETWCLSCIGDLEVREKAFAEMERVVKPGGKIILVENDEGGEFDEILKESSEFRDSMLNRGFSVKEKIKTQFKFKTVEEARRVFGDVLGERGKQVSSNIIKHNIIIFEKLV